MGRGHVIGPQSGRKSGLSVGRGPWDPDFLVCGCPAVIGLCERRASETVGTVPGEMYIPQTTFHTKNTSHTLIFNEDGIEKLIWFCYLCVFFFFFSLVHVSLC